MLFNVVMYYDFCVYTGVVRRAIILTGICFDNCFQIFCVFFGTSKVKIGIFHQQREVFSVQRGVTEWML